MAKIQLSQNASNITDADLDKSFMRLQRLLEKKIRIFWHKKYFKKYSHNKVIPWGLRIQIFPILEKSVIL